MSARPDARSEALRRSPLFGAAALKGLPLDINAGSRDGYGRMAPVRMNHSIQMYNAIAAPTDRLNDSYAFWDRVVRDQHELQTASLDEHYKVFFRQQSGAARLSIFEGAHEFLSIPAMNWLAPHRRSRQKSIVRIPVHPEALART